MRQERLDTGWGPGRESTHSYNTQGPPRCGEWVAEQREPAQFLFATT